MKRTQELELLESVVINLLKVFESTNKRLRFLVSKSPNWSGWNEKVFLEIQVILDYVKLLIARQKAISREARRQDLKDLTIVVSLHLEEVNLKLLELVKTLPRSGRLVSAIERDLKLIESLIKIKDYAQNH